MSRKETPTKGKAAGVVAGDNGAVSDDIERARLASIIDSSYDAILSKTLDGTITSWNAAAERLYGYTAEEAVGREIFVIVPPELHGQVREILAGLRSGEGGFRGETVRMRKDGSRVEVAVTVSPIRNSAGEVVGGSTIARDITELKKAKGELARRVRQAALGADVGGTLAEGGVSLRNALQRCCEAVVRHLDAAFARVWTLERGSDVLELQASAGVYTHTNGAHGRVPVGKFKIGLIAAERKPHLTNAVVGDPRVGDQEWAERERMVAFAGYPLLVEDRLVGVLAMFSRAALPEDTLEALSSVANVIAQGIERKRAEEALEELLSEREQALEEVSTPVVPVLEGVLVLPLIGSLDTRRAERATRAALSEVVRQGARVLILDITGARIVDSHAVARLTSLVQALKLVGADAYVTGVGAQVAQTLVGLGLDMHGLKTFRTLAQALATLIGNGARR
ncbi:MAG TPA: PAS domain S-box protein [Pyrinomonadaceae bacterium]|jgi:PAS domain S-box-containing protein|nr:PAS domain S-box protein [Pyrinomonadaceae bacterium]